MSALTDGTLGAEPVTDLAELAAGRKKYWELYQYRLPLQPSEIAAGLTQSDIDAQIAATVF